MKRKIFLKVLASTTMVGTGLKSLGKLAQTWEEGDKMPALFVGHGNPMNAISENSVTRGWREMGKGLNPRAILVVSAHWQTRGTLVTMVDNPRTIHDFGGFPQALFDVEYPAPGAPDVALELIQGVTNATVEEDHEWGLDHGTWSVLIKMFPNADVPVLQLSLDYRQGPKYHYALAQQLDFLRKRGVMIVGSGNIIHNLQMAKWQSNEPYDWAVDFDQKVKDLIDNQTHELLINYEQLGTPARLSIPTNEHYLPMLYTLGLQGDDEKITYFNDHIDMGSMSMRSFVVG
ncbi:MAG: 4,5-DOPA dioxygenase extradiol [Cyclobacteriaceae bacterium]